SRVRSRASARRTGIYTTADVLAGCRIHRGSELADCCIHRGSNRARSSASARQGRGQGHRRREPARKVGNGEREKHATIFALFQTASRLSRKEFKERLISYTLLELQPEPKQELASMKVLDLATRLADGNGALPLLLQTVPLFIEKGVGK